MSLYVLLLLASLCIYIEQGSTQPDPPDHHMHLTNVCLSCQDVTDPANCTNYESCHGDGICVTEAYHANHQTHFNLYCQHGVHCHHNHNGPGSIVGKRRTTVCSQCCKEKHGCNRHLCSGFVTPPTAAPTKAPTPAPTHHIITKAPTLAPILFTATGSHHTTIANSPHCRDHEEDGVACASLDLFNLCSDTSVLSYVLVHKKCAKHCGICHSTVPSNSVPVTPPPSGVCADYEQDGLDCVSLDLFNICTDPATLPYVIAHEKCRKHCGFCTASSGK